MQRILCLDDEDSMLEYLELIKPAGCSIIPVRNDGELYRLSGSQLIDIVIMDTEFGGGRHRGLLADVIKKVHPVPVVVHSREAGCEAVVRCLKTGAVDFVAKPMTAMAMRRVLGQVVHEGYPERTYHDFDELCLGSGHNRSVFKFFVHEFFQPGACCFLAGEAGTGVFNVARKLHRESIKKCPGDIRRIMKNLAIYSPGSKCQDRQMMDLVGEPGAKHRGGLFRENDGGTVMIEHCETLSHLVQHEVLKVLHSQQLAGCALLSRVVLSSEKKLEDLIASGRLIKGFESLLVGMTLNLPALRNRQAEFAQIVWFLFHAIQKNNPHVTARRIGPGVIQRLAGHDWACNLRELRRCLAAACLKVTAEVLELRHLRLPGFSSGSGNHEP